MVDGSLWATQAANLNRDVWRNRTQNTVLLIFSFSLVVFLNGPLNSPLLFPLRTVSTFEVSKISCTVSCKWHNQCRTEGLLSECWLTLKHSGRASHSLCRTERVFMLTHCPSICGKAGLLETSGTSTVKTDTALCLARYSAQSKMAYSFEWG